ncbi:MAG: glycosyltransferase [Azoarcus sp.]|nr:glycosyltransferase [Azoarcus sp.]
MSGVQIATSIFLSAKSQDNNQRKVFLKEIFKIMANLDNPCEIQPKSVSIPCKKPDGKRIVFLARSLSRGGAERQLLALARGLHTRGYAVSVIVFYNDETGYETDLKEVGIPFVSLGKKGRWDILPFLWRMIRALKRENPAILHGYLPVPNIMSALLRPFLPGVKIAWGIRNAYLDLAHYDWLSRFSSTLERHLSPLADVIIANSWAGRACAMENGFPAHKIIVVPNGIDTDHFRFSAEARKTFRKTLGFTDAEILVGLVGRLDPMKDHGNFLKAAQIVLRSRPDIRFACVGNGNNTEYTGFLKRQSEDLGLKKQLAWLPAQKDMISVYSSMDISVLASSFGEGFPNVIGETMSCGLPCAVTDVGDTKIIVGDTGKVVAPKSETALAEAILSLAALSPEARRQLGEKCRTRIVEKFGIERLLSNTEMALTSLWS